MQSRDVCRDSRRQSMCHDLASRISRDGHFPRHNTLTRAVHSFMHTHARVCCHVTSHTHTHTRTDKHRARRMPRTHSLTPLPMDSATHSEQNRTYKGLHAHVLRRRRRSPRFLMPYMCSDRCTFLMPHVPSCVLHCSCLGRVYASEESVANERGPRVERGPNDARVAR